MGDVLFRRAGCACTPWDAALPRQCASVAGSGRAQASWFVRMEGVMSEHHVDLPEIDLSKPPAEGIVRVSFQPEGKTVEFPFGTLPYDGHGQPMSLLDVAENYGIFMDHACGGVCACTTCHVYVKEGAAGLNDPEDDELDRIDLAAGPQTNS